MTQGMETYTDVGVLDSYGKYLTNGVGFADGDPNHLTYIECGQFNIDYLPTKGKTYSVSGTQGQWQMSKSMICSTSGTTSRFRVPTLQAELDTNVFTAVNGTTFHVQNNTMGQLQGQYILVFLTPILNSGDYLYAAWQQLNPGEGSIEPFYLSQDISVEAISPNGTVTSPVQISPGYLASVTNPGGLSPVIGTPVSSSSVKPYQCGLNNATTPYEAIQASWLVNGNIVVTSSVGLTEGANSIFQLQTKLYWAVGMSTVGANYTLNQITPMQTYVLPSGTADVKVVVTFDTTSGEYIYTFDPPSDG